MRMRAAVLCESGLPPPYAQSRPLRLDEVDLDDPGPGEVLIALRAAGLCHSDLSVIDGNRPRPLPMLLGHEAAGTVEAMGPGVTRFSAGDHVVLAFVPSCGACEPCARGRPALCEPGAVVNAAGTLLSGGIRLHRGVGLVKHHLGVSAFASHAVVAQESLVKVDRTLAFDHAALFGCAVITGVGAVVNTGVVTPEASIAVIGLGGVGLAALLGALTLQPRVLVAVDFSTEKLALAVELGATHVFRADDADCVAKIREATRGGVEYAFEMAGSARAMETAYQITRRGGTTVTAGLSNPKAMFSVPHVGIVAEERTIKGSYLGSCVPQRDIPRYIEWFQAGRLPVDRLLSERIALEDINAAFDRLAAGTGLRQVITQF